MLLPDVKLSDETEIRKQRKRIDELQHEILRFERRVSRSMRVIDSPSKLDCYTPQSEHTGYSPRVTNWNSNCSIDDDYSQLDVQFEKSLDAVKNLKADLLSAQEKNEELSKTIEEQTNSIKVLTLENDIYLRGQTFYIQQIKKLEERNQQLLNECDKKLAEQSIEFKKEIHSLRETIYQKQSLLNESAIRISDMSLCQSEKSLRNSVMMNGSNETGLKRKIALLEVI